MSHLLSTDESLLLVIDIQEKFKPILYNSDQVINGIQQMVRACNYLDIPVIVSEQYPKGLGSTLPELQGILKNSTPVLEKTSFGCYDEPSLEEEIRRQERSQIMICGIEAHVCVNQTAIQLLEGGYQVFLIEDAIGARSERNYHIALKKLAQLGAVPSCIEMAIFELMRTSRHPEFKALQKLIL